MTDAKPPSLIPIVHTFQSTCSDILILFAPASRLLFWTACFLPLPRRSSVEGRVSLSIWSIVHLIDLLRTPPTTSRILTNSVYTNRRSVSVRQYKQISLTMSYLCICQKLTNMNLTCQAVVDLGQSHSNSIYDDFSNPLDAGEISREHCPLWRR